MNHRVLSVLHTESSKGWGGQETRTLREAIGLKRLGARVTILSQPDSCLSQRAEAEGLEVRVCPIRSSIDFSALFFILGLIRRENVDLVVTHSGNDSFIGAVAGRLSALKPRIVRTRHLALPITSRVTYSLFPHRVVAVSDFVKDYLVKEKGLPYEKVVSIPTGVDIDRFDPVKVKGCLRDEIDISPDVPLVGVVAILRRKKGHHILLESIPAVLKKIPDAVFLFVGDGPQRENIENRVNDLKIRNNVLFLGMRRDIPEILQAIDLFVLPTLQEALGTSFLEAMAMSKAVVGTRVGGIPEIVRDGINGLLVEAEDPSSLADAVSRLLGDRQMRRSMGIEGRKIVEEDYTIDIMTRRLFNFYSSLTKAEK